MYFYYVHIVRKENANEHICVMKLNIEYIVEILFTYIYNFYKLVFHRRSFLEILFLFFVIFLLNLSKKIREIEVVRRSCYLTLFYLKDAQGHKKGTTTFLKCILLYYENHFLSFFCPYTINDKKSNCQNLSRNVTSSLKNLPPN